MRQIQRDLCKCDIVEEVFSKYTSQFVIRFYSGDPSSSFRCRYPELRDLELKQLSRTLLSADPGPALHALKDKIKAYTRGQLPHAKDVLPALYEFMGKGEELTETPTEPPAYPEQGVADGDWKGLKDALTRSLTSGSFLDSQFYALDSNPQAGTPTIRPIYFCSMVGGTFLPKLVKCKFPTPGS